MNSTEFMAAAQRVGVGSHLSATFLIAPDHLGKRLLDAAKRLARFLKDSAPDLGHRKRLEAVAQGAGFPNWHAFQTLCQHFVEHYAPPDRGSRRRAAADVFEPFIPALPLLIAIGADNSPDADQIAGVEALGRRLAVALGQPLPVILDSLAKLYNADTWSLLCKRRPEDSAAPLYVFTAVDGGGEFQWSPACAALVEELDALWQGYDDLPKAAQTKARRYVETITKKRPDFLEGSLAFASIMALDGEPAKTGPILAEAIQRANQLIPTQFKGEISWYYLNNRFYHRLLFAHMRWCAEFGSMELAIELAQRQLRLNKDDNLGVRISLPALLAANGEYAKAKVALERISKPDDAQDGHILLVRSLCLLVAGDTEEGKALFLRALFAFPALRPLILERSLPDIRSRDRKWHRGCIPDVEMLWFDYCNVCEGNPAKTEEVFVRLLQQPAVLTAEKELEALFGQASADRQKPDETGKTLLSDWEAATLETSTRLAVG